MIYIGLTGGTFKKRYNNHIKSFRHEIYAKDTALSKYIWEQKNNSIDHYIKWSIIKRSNTNRRDSGQCNLCMAEKIAILNAKHSNLLNKRSELISTCRHSKQHNAIT